MDLRNKSDLVAELLKSDSLSESETESAKTPSAITQLADFSADLAHALRGKNLETIRALVVQHVSAMMNADVVQLVYASESRIEGDAECSVDVKGALGVLAVIRVGDKRDWSAMTTADLAMMNAVATQLALGLDNIRLGNELQRQQTSSIQALAAAIEVKDRYTAGHTKRVGVYADVLSEHLPVIESEKEKIRLAGVLHDIGKIGVPDRILLKPESLTGSEWEEMRLHTEAGFDIVSRVAGLEDIAEILRHHHERWNGTGYPRGLKADAIPFASRVISVADTFDAIVTDRPYRPAMTPEAAHEIIVELSGIHFDPVVVDAFIVAFPKLRECALDVTER